MKDKPRDKWGESTQQVPSNNKDKVGSGEYILPGPPKEPGRTKHSKVNKEQTIKRVCGLIFIGIAIIGKVWKYAQRKGTADKSILDEEKVILVPNIKRDESEKKEPGTNEDGDADTVSLTTATVSTFEQHNQIVPNSLEINRPNIIWMKKTNFDTFESITEELAQNIGVSNHQL